MPEMLEKLLSIAVIIGIVILCVMIFFFPTGGDRSK